MASGAIDDALFAFLRADGPLAALVPGGWFRDLAPESVAQPFGIITLQATEDERVFGGRAVEILHLLIKVVASGTDGTSARAGAERMDALLDGTGLTTEASGYRCIYSARTSRVAYVEEDGELRWQHRGGIYELHFDKLS